MNELRVDSLSYQPNRYTKEILKQISESFKKGGFYGILGPNGSGKTTFIRHLLGLLKTQKGIVTLEDRKLTEYSKKELASQLAFVPQNTYLEAEFTVFDIVAMGRTPYRKRFTDLKPSELVLITEAMEITNTAALQDKRFNQLSGGEAQRVLVARAIVQDTPWLILDEPISHLDIKHQIELMETLKRLNREKNKTIIAILHDLNLAGAYCNDVILMKQGEVFATGHTREVLSKENLREVYGLDFEIQEIPSVGQTYYIPIPLAKEYEDNSVATVIEDCGEQEKLQTVEAMEIHS